MAAESSVESTINAAWSAANTAQSAAESYSDQAMSAAAGFATSGAIHELGEPVKPTITYPTDDLGTIFNNEHDASLNELKTLLDDRLTKFLDTYYPDYTSKLATISDWLDNAITNGGTGLPAAIESQLWDRARTRVDTKAIQAEDEVASIWAARGFPLPPGAAAKQLLQVQQQNQHETNALSREIAIKQAEMEIENIRFAVQTGANLKMGIVAAASRYMTAIVGVASLATTKAASLVDAIKSLRALTLAYHSTYMEAEKLILSYDIAKADDELTHNQIDVEAFRARNEMRVNAALAAAKAMGDIAAAAIGSQNTMATINHSTEATE